MSGIKRALDEAVDHAFFVGRSFDGTVKMTDVIVVKEATKLAGLTWQETPEWLVDMIVEAYSDGIRHTKEFGPLPK